MVVVEEAETRVVELARLGEGGCSRLVPGELPVDMLMLMTGVPVAVDSIVLYFESQLQRLCRA